MRGVGGKYAAVLCGLPHIKFSYLVREFVPLVLWMREVQVSMAGGVPQMPPFLQAVPIGLVGLMVVQPFLEPAVQYLGAEVPGFFQLAESLVLYLLKY